MIHTSENTLAFFRPLYGEGVHELGVRLSAKAEKYQGVDVHIAAKEIPLSSEKNPASKLELIKFREFKRRFSDIHIGDLLTNPDTHEIILEWLSLAPSIDEVTIDKVRLNTHPKTRGRFLWLILSKDEREKLESYRWLMCCAVEMAANRLYGLQENGSWKEYKPPRIKLAYMPPHSLSLDEARDLEASVNEDLSGKKVKAKLGELVLPRQKT